MSLVEVLQLTRIVLSIAALGASIMAILESRKAVRSFEAGLGEMDS